MENTAKLIFEGKEYEFPIVVGTENEKAINIEKLRALTGLVTLDSGYKNTGSCKSAITFLDGEKGILRYRGYNIEELAAKAEFLEVAYLLIFGELPTAEEYDDFKKTIHKYTLVHEDMRHIMDGFPRSAHPMGVLASATSALTAFNPVPVNVHCPKHVYQAVCKAIAKVTIIATWVYRKREGLPLNYYDNKKGYIENILRLFFEIPTEEYKINPTIVSALNKLLILHGDHEQNCSTSTVRLVGSSEAGLFASISSGVSALWGRLHGGANQAVIEMLNDIHADGGGVDKFINKAKDKDDPFRLMGFGHRVYKNFDPRAKVLKSMCDQLFDEIGINTELLKIAKKIEEIALNDEYFISRNLYPNVDFYSGLILKALSIPNDMFAVIFVIGRIPGWISQWIELKEQESIKIVRPRQLYVGETNRTPK